MTAYSAWTPASRPGIVPLHPLGFGTILGRSFAALRQNPRVLLGFALGVQVAVYIVLSAAIAGVAFATFSRLDTLRTGSDEYEAVLTGSIGITVVAAFVLTLLTTAVSVVVQGVVIAEVAHQVVAEKLRVGPLWRRVKPVFWRLLGYSLLITLALAVAIAAVVLVVVAAVALTPVAGVLVAIFAILAAIPLMLWLSVKLLLVPAIIVIEHGRVMPAIARSWRLTRQRFWPTLGIIVVIAVVMGFVTQAVSIPFSFLGSGLLTILSPTGEPGPTAVISFIVVTVFTQILTLLLQAVTIVVQATATTLIYVDSRMRKEGLDLDLLAYVDQRDAGVPGLADPYLAHIGVDRPTQYGAQPYPYPVYAVPPQGAYPGQQGAAPGYAPGFSPAAPYGAAGPVAPAHPAPVAPYSTGVGDPVPPRQPDSFPPVPPVPPPASATPAPPPETEAGTDRSTRWAAPGAPTPEHPDSA